MHNYSRNTFDKDPFNKLKNYVSVRLQQGVPLVDADWNEKDDIRRFEIEAFLKWFIGDGVPKGSDAFRIERAADRIYLTAPASAKPQRFLIEIDVAASTSSAAAGLGFGPNNFKIEAISPPVQLTGKVNPSVKAGDKLRLLIGDPGPANDWVTLEFKEDVTGAGNVAKAMANAMPASLQDKLAVGFGSSDHLIIKGGDGKGGVGLCLVEGWDAMTFGDVLFSKQSLEQAQSVCYLDVWEQEIDSDDDPELIDTRIGIETCVRVKRVWAVRQAITGSADYLEKITREPGHVYYPLATLTAGELKDLRCTCLATLPEEITVSHGKVGIGIQPEEKLHVAGNLKLTGGGLYVEQGSGELRFSHYKGNEDVTGLSVKNSAPQSTSTPNLSVLSLCVDKQTWQLRVEGGDENKFKIYDATHIRQCLTIDTEGNVGIGTADPKAKLDIGNLPTGTSHGTNMWFRIGDGGDAGRVWIQYGEQAAPTLVLSDDDDPPRIWLQQTGVTESGSNTTFSEENPKHVCWIGQAKSHSNDLAIMGGNVGIGTTTTSAKLTVAVEDVRDGILLSGKDSKAVALLTNNTQGAFNGLTQPGDHLLLWQGAKVDDPGAGLVIAPWRHPPSGIRIDADGNVGIGTAQPGETLEVNGRIKSGALTIGQWPHDSSYVFFGTNTLDQSNQANYALLQSTTNGETYLNSPENIRFRIGNADKMVLTKEGNVGIGTAQLDGRLTVKSDDPGYGSLSFFSSGADIKYDGGTDKIFVFKGPDDGKTAFMGGNVGIGTAQPGETLEVNGRVKSGALTIGEWPHDSGYVFFGTNNLGQSNEANYALLQSTTNGETYLNSPENIRFRIGNADKMVLTKEGNVGIGTTNPTSTLQIAGEVALEKRDSATARTLPAGATLCWNDGGWLRLNQNLDYTKPVFGVYTPGVFVPDSLNIGGAGGFGDPGSGNVWITGNVGVGTTTPHAKLEVAGGAIMPAAGNSESAGLLFPKDPGGGGDDAAWMRYYARAGEATTLEIGISNDLDDHIALMASGSVGIGTVTPVNKLDVNGCIALQGKHAFRGDDSWLRLNQDGAFPSGVHTPGVFAPMSLNVGGVGEWGNPGAGNVWITGNVSVSGQVSCNHCLAKLKYEDLIVTSSDSFAPVTNLGVTITLSHESMVFVKINFNALDNTSPGWMPVDLRIRLDYVLDDNKVELFFPMDSCGCPPYPYYVGYSQIVYFTVPAAVNATIQVEWKAPSGGIAVRSESIRQMTVFSL